MAEQTAVVPHYAQVQMSTFGQGALPALQSLSDVVSIAQLMAKSGVAVRKHLRENPGACFAVTMQALRWNADPFAVANKSYAVNDQIAYEAQLIAAVINTMAPIKKRPHYTYEGEGADRVCVCTVEMLDGDVLEKRSPKFSAITPKNSPLWKSDPDQQQAYYTIRAWARLHTPEVILGIYDPEEAAGMEPTRIQPEKTDLVGKLSKAVEGEGFQPERVEAELSEEAKPKRRGRPPKNPEPEEPTHASQPEEPVNETPETEHVEADVSTDDGIPEHMLDDDGPATVEEAREEFSDPDDAPEWTDEQAANAAILEGDNLVRPLMDPETGHAAAVQPPYKTASPEAQSLLDARPTQTGSAPPAEPEPATSETASDASSDGARQVEGSGPSQPQEDVSPEYAEFLSAIRSASQWSEVPAAMRAFYNSDAFKSLSPEEQNEVRRVTWATCVERSGLVAMKNDGGAILRDEHGKPLTHRPLEGLPDQADDLSAYRLWLEAQDDTDAIEGTVRLLRRSEAWAKASEGAQNIIEAATQARLESLA